jgi:SurA N-terminal domain
LLGVLLAAVGLALVGCQPSPGAAAYIGDRKVSDQQVRDDEASELAVSVIKDAVQRQFGDDLGPFRRLLLNERIVSELTNEAADRNHLSVPDSAVQQAIDADGGYQTLAQQGGLSHDLAFRRYRYRLLLQELGYTTGKVRRPTEEQLRQAYEQAASQRETAQLGITATKPEQLDAAYARVKANPDQFATIAASYPGSSPQPAEYQRAQLPPEVGNAKAGEIVKYVGTGADAGKYFVVKVFTVTRPSFAELRSTLLQPSQSQAEQAGLSSVGQLAKQIGVRVSPRYGTWDPQKVAIGDTPNSVVTVPSPKASTPAADGGAPANS